MSQRQKKLSDIPFKIVVLLHKKDKPLIAAHIAKGIKETQQLAKYHLDNLVKKGVVVVETEYDTKYYRLQPSFYMEEAETALMKVLTPWIQEFAKETEVTADMMAEKEEIVRNNLHYYFMLFLSKTV